MVGVLSCLLCLFILAQAHKFGVQYVVTPGGSVQVILDSALCMFVYAVHIYVLSWAIYPSLSFPLVTPSGSQDDDVIGACNEYGIAMAFSGLVEGLNMASRARRKSNSEDERTLH